MLRYEITETGSLKFLLPTAFRNTAKFYMEYMLYYDMIEIDQVPRFIRDEVKDHGKLEAMELAYIPEGLRVVESEDVPILTDGENYWWFPEYQIVSYLDTLYRLGEVEWTRGVEY